MSYENIISIIVCTYNQAGTIGRALDSILNQKCSWDIEIIIGEDCSTDNTRQICEEYAHRYPHQIRLFANDKNKGLLNNYYDCLLQAKGKYIADLAGDDEWCDPYKLERQVTFMESHPEVVLTHTDYRLREESTGKFQLPPFNHGPRHIVDGENLTTAILTQRRRPVIHLCTALYRNEAFRQCYDANTDLFRNTDYPCEDLQLCALLSRRGKIAYDDVITLAYSISPSISRNQDDARQFDFVKRVTQLSFDLQQRLQLPTDQNLTDYYGDRTYALLMHAFRANRKDLRQEALDCSTQWPFMRQFRHRSITFITQFSLLWTVALFFRKQLLKLRRHHLC